MTRSAMNDTEDDYYKRASGWAVARQAAADRSRRVAWAVAGVAVGVIVLQATALILLTPLKTVEPVTLLVDRTTGFVQAVKPLEANRVAGDTALTQSFLVQYVIAREGFERATLQQDYRKVALWSEGRARGEYLATMPLTNPQSPLNLYPGATSVDVAVKSVSPIRQGLARVRFDTRVDGGQTRAPRSWIATVRYRYSDAPMSLQDRYVNPLGFQVVAYRRDPEALPAYAEPPAPAAAQDLGEAARPTSAPAVPARTAARAMPATATIVLPMANLPMGSPLGPGR